MQVYVSRETIFFINIFIFNLLIVLCNVSRETYVDNFELFFDDFVFNIKSFKHKPTKYFKF